MLKKHREYLQKNVKRSPVFLIHILKIFHKPFLMKGKLYGIFEIINDDICFLWLCVIFLFIEELKSFLPKKLFVNYQKSFNNSYLLTLSVSINQNVDNRFSKTQINPGKFIFKKDKKVNCSRKLFGVLLSLILSE